jgi:hypothetical protein
MPPEALAAAARRKSNEALARAHEALRDLDAKGDAINFQAVARAAGVSRQWLYTQHALRAEIERLRDRQMPRSPERIPTHERATEASLRQRVETLLEENRRLRSQLAELREEVALAYGERRDRDALHAPP